MTALYRSVGDFIKTSSAQPEKMTEVVQNRNRLFIDISRINEDDAKTGIQRVTRSILKHLSDNPPAGYDICPVYATFEQSGYREKDNIEKEISGSAGDVFLGLDLYAGMVIRQKESLKILHENGVKIYFVVYDLIPILFPSYYPIAWNMSLNHIEWLKTIINFDGAVCISESVADELKLWIQDIIPDRYNRFYISWFHLGADIDGSNPTTGIPENADLVMTKVSKRNTFLMVGTLEPRKRQDQVLASFEILWKAGIDVNLVIVGKKGWMVDNLCDVLNNHKEKGNRLFWLEGISDEYLNELFTQSTCLIAASLGEGFGLPLIEAAQKQLPIIARDIPVFREVAGTNAYYFSGTTAKELSDTILAWLDLYKNNEHPKSDNMPFLTWEESTKQLWYSLKKSF